MSSFSIYSEYAVKASSWTNELMEELQLTEEKAARIIRIVLHTLRNQIPVKESFHLISQLPIIWKGIYVDGWKLQDSYQRMKGWPDYLNALRELDKDLAGFDWGNDEKAKHIVLSVWKLLFKHVSENEMRHICNSLPHGVGRDLKNILKEAMI
jgi:uncharacterized protein (DUF2267 family)